MPLRSEVRQCLYAHSHQHNHHLNGIILGIPRRQYSENYQKPNQGNTWGF